MTRFCQHRGSRCRIAVDPHKLSCTAVAVAADLTAAAALRVKADWVRYGELRRFAVDLSGIADVTEQLCEADAPLSPAAEMVLDFSFLGSPGFTAADHP